MNKKQRNIGLDVVRSIAILMVLICHSSISCFKIYNALYMTQVDAILIDFLSYFGIIGVNIFFVLSGFLIGKILIRDFITNFNGNIKKTLLNFYIRRWLRTLPMYYIVLALSIFLAVNLNSNLSQEFFWNKIPNYFFFLQSFLGYAKSGVFEHILMGVSWSLVIEEWFYLLFPLFIIFLIKYKKNFNDKIFFKFLLGYFVFTVIFPICCNYYPLKKPPILINLITILNFKYLAIGILLAYLLVFFPSIYNLLQKKRLLILSFIVPFLDWSNELFFQNIILKTILSNIYPIVIAIFIVFCEQKINIKNKLISSFSTFISKISYSLYLLHLPLLFYFFTPITYIILEKKSHLQIPETLFFTLFFTVYFVFISIISILFYQKFEAPIMNLRDSLFIKNLIYDKKEKINNTIKQLNS